MFRLPRVEGKGPPHGSNGLLRAVGPPVLVIGRKWGLQVWTHVVRAGNLEGASLIDPPYRVLERKTLRVDEGCVPPVHCLTWIEVAHAPIRCASRGPKVVA